MSFLDEELLIEGLSDMLIKCFVFSPKRSKNGGSNATLQWISSHCGVADNEFANTLTKVGSNLSQPDPPVLERIITARFKTCHHETISNSGRDLRCQTLHAPWTELINTDFFLRTPQLLQGSSSAAADFVRDDPLFHPLLGGAFDFLLL
ncbi:hypothetical protein CDAR_237861 [Caerostris darwini]|uniref:RNase H type-1 domain-containing protein n=1 Tax=Caerostris darwini TaxID=1538125 RepID=A0AAV4S3E8_9ARAC|nr:hypothetical protein CDAR_237861 [Caerostris darwini]